jgi:hypothetical protein
LDINSFTAKTIKVRWSLKIEKNPNWIELYIEEIFNPENFEKIIGEKQAVLNTPDVSGRIKAEIEITDAFGDTARDYVIFNNFASKYKTSEVDLLHSALSLNNL